MHASRIQSTSHTIKLVHQGSSRRRLRHAHVRARVATLERKDTFRGPTADRDDEHAMQSNIDVLRDSIEQLEASYARSAVQRTVSQDSTAPELVQSAGPRHAHARQLRRARRSSRSAAVSDASVLDASTRLGAPMGVNDHSIGDSNAEALRTIMDLWHLLQQKQQEDSQHHGPHSRSPQWWEQDPPRLLTADEERVLGTVVQQHRQLQQLYEQHPEAAANLQTLAASVQTTNSTSSNHHSSSPNHGDSSSSSTSSKRARITNSSSGDSSRHGNQLWPPPLTQDEVAEVCCMSVAWRAMLPELAETAKQLLVSYNVRLVMHMRKYSIASNLPWDDALQAGLTGLKVAAQRYDPARRTRFSTVASMWILAALNRTATSQSGSILLPDRYLHIFRHVMQTYGAEAVANIDHRPDVVQKVSATFDTRPGTILRIIKATSSSYLAGSLDAPSYQGPTGSKGEEGQVPWSAMVTSDDLDDDDGDADSSNGLATEASFVAAGGQLPTWLHEQQQHRQRHSKTDDELQLEDWLSVLNWRERQIMLLSYDMPGQLTSSIRGSGGSSSSHGENENGKRPKGMTLAAVAKQVGLTTERVRQIKMTALKKLQIAAGDRVTATSDSAASNSSISGGGGSSSSTSSSSRRRMTSADAYTSTSREQHTAAAPARSPSAPAAQQVIIPSSNVDELPPGISAAIKRCAARARHGLLLVYHVRSQLGDMPTGDFTLDGEKLGRYCDDVLLRYRKRRLQSNIAAAFEVIAPGWLASASAAQQQRVAEAAKARGHTSFKEYLSALRQYVKQHGRLPANGEVYKGLKLGAWAYQQRYRKDKMVKKKQRALERVPGWAWPRWRQRESHV